MILLGNGDSSPSMSCLLLLLNVSQVDLHLDELDPLVASVSKRQLLLFQADLLIVWPVLLHVDQTFLGIRNIVIDIVRIGL